MRNTQETFVINPITADKFVLSNPDGLVNGNYYIVDTASLKGWIKRIEFDSGPVMLVWNITTEKDVVLDRQAVTGSDKLFCCTYFIEPEEALVRLTEDHAAAPVPLSRRSHILSNNTSLQLLIESGKTIRVVSIHFTFSWIAGQLPKGFVLPAIDPSYLSQSLPLFLTSATELSEDIGIKNIYDYTISNSHPLLIKSILYFLLYKSVERLSGYSKLVTERTLKNNYDDIVMHAESKIMASLRTDMPCIDNLAKELYVSSSTLKRYFKKAFGKNIYNYYLERKMELARGILMQGRMNISETSAHLGYENTSHFTSLFKKMHGYSPNTLRKKFMQEN